MDDHSGSCSLPVCHRAEHEPALACPSTPSVEPVTPEVTRTESEGVDYGWVMQVTFVLTIVVGTPVVVLLSVPATLPTWTDRAQFAVGIGSMVWFVVAILVFLYARRTQT